MFAELIASLGGENASERFRTILPYAFAGTVVLMVLHFLISLVFRGKRRERKRWNLWDILIYLGLLGCVTLLAITSFTEVIRHGALLGWPLFLHMCGAGAFTALLPLLILSWGHLNQFGAVSTPPKFSWLAKLTFWVILAGGLAVTLSMLISMLPIYGTHGLHVLLDVHRYSGLVVVLALVLHFYGVARQRLASR